MSADPDCSDAFEGDPSDPLDCDDTHSGIHPGAVELPGDGIDQDCDGGEICFVDADDDGVRPDGVSTVASADTNCTGPGEASAAHPVGDCDDGDANRYPGAIETCNGTDDNCNGIIDADANCAPSPLCGNGIVSAGEECDDGNQTSQDGCSRFCEVQTGWSCAGGPSTCAPDCGDGLIVSEEECDDGNETRQDGCNQFCQVESVWECEGVPSVCRPEHSLGWAFGDGACTIERGSASPAWLLALPPIWILAARRGRGVAGQRDGRLPRVH
jgi:cysteine-rich repeat protein